ncbi:MAG: hypothetical protein JW833_18025, partial [Prolixibacteraceae bacterium]|nr:hypothetical protein [Prolixibacteraceae bacterium]
VWGSNDKNILDKVKESDLLLCRYYEHTFGTNQTSSKPYGYFNLGHLAEKSIYAYRPYEKAKWLVAQRMRSYFSNKEEGLYVINPGNAGYSGWVTLDKNSFRNVDYKTVRNIETGKVYKLYYSGKDVNFFVNDLEANSYRQFILSKDSLISEKIYPAPEIRTDNLGWPVSVKCKNMEQPLFQGEIGKFLSLESIVGRRIEPEIWDVTDSLKRSEKVAESTRQEYASTSEKTKKTETPFSIIFEQKFSHARLKEGTRILEVMKGEPRVSVDINFNRLSSSNPEVFYIEFPLPDLESFPFVSNGGEEFQPYNDQIPGTCTDFFTIDGWVNYPSENGSWLWSSCEAPLISFSEPQLASKRLTPPDNMNKILAMVYNNMWEVNFLNDCPGEINFHFDLVWKNKKINSDEADDITYTYNIKPLIILNPKTREDKFTFKRMNEIK